MPTEHDELVEMLSTAHAAFFESHFEHSGKPKNQLADLIASHVLATGKIRTLERQGLLPGGARSILTVNDITALDALAPGTVIRDNTNRVAGQVLIVHSIEQLAALPQFAVIEAKSGQVYQRYATDQEEKEPWETMNSTFTFANSEIDLPAKVLR